MTRHISLCFLLLCLFAACSPYATDDLVGQWQSISITEEGDSLAIDPSQVRFQFTADGRYSYQSTLNYEEGGRYEISDKYLLSTDTTRANQGEKAVQIIQLVNDSLILKMKEMEKERLLVLVRQ